MIWISTKPYITHKEEINAYVNKYAYICICDSSIISTNTRQDFDFGVLHPVARALSRLSGKKPSFATTVQGVYCILYLDRYMFRPSLTIIKWLMASEGQNM
jgi:hypothetical protein